MGTSTAQYTTSARNPTAARKRLTAAIVCIVLVSIVGIAIYHERYDFRSYALLIRFADPQAAGPLLRLETREISVEEVAIPIEGGSIPARLYTPVGLPHPH